ncbi:UNVERIFIED_CONTAM: serine protease Do [Acetivibrio alkalicellulosi]
MRKKFIAYLVLVHLLLFFMFFSINTFSNSRIKIYVNGNEINEPVHLINDRTYLPVRAISEALGANVEWDDKNRVVNINHLSSDDNLIPEIIKDASPSVVGIIGTLKRGSNLESRYTDNIVHGTGVVISSKGEILTNAHVVADMERIVVILSSGEGFEANLINIDIETDLAVIKINKQDLKPAKLGKEEDIIIGKTVIAIGTPVSFSLRNSASLGIISGVNRSINSSYRLIQTDAAINPGNSGGPLINLKGEVIGINSNKYSGSNIEGLGFSIPIGTVKYVLEHFKKYGVVRRPTLGVELEEDWAAKVGLPTNSGLTISRVREGSAAMDHGLLEEDVIISINGSSINTLVDYNEEMKKYIPSDKITIKIRRGGIILDVIVVLG